jgi:hypothetical protein
MSNVKNLFAACINCYEENDVFTIGIGMTIMTQKILSLSDDSTKMNYPLTNALDSRVSQRNMR